ncbi:DUF3473 domain-containing protein [Dissulfurirhabdus thermomarina]|uniref:DUF3473 domain-containing protein n=1 Tax=Dissulfurirhabdus thermomarina TaxID=1765737 RepID=A0A6N9TSY1_DISTH|nr:polysaccharide deacetylase family protein [Dissulfurirhabdus thermomarina]NDY43510.1 DUF3473 domain-containing protein [Dissulfurirhabdus thermomarina]NMX23005.1 DUF3473 domain-containing protein [Dissulfurirhabdus thermomarina]
MKNVLSIDWEDWFHVCEVDRHLPRQRWDAFPSILDEATDVLLDLLQRRRTRATFFVVGYSAERQPELVRRIAREGHEVAYHGYDHTLVYETAPAAFAGDLAMGRALLGELTGQEIRGFRAPQWSLNQRAPWAVDEIIRAGFRYDSSRAPLPIVGNPAFPRSAHVLEVEEGRGRLVELPPLVLDLPGLPLPAGGGWGLRTWPLAAVVARARAMNRAGSPAVFHFHPVEFVRERPRARLPLVKRFVLRFGLRSTRRAWDYLLDRLEFTTAWDCVQALGR